MSYSFKYHRRSCQTRPQWAETSPTFDVRSTAEVSGSLQNRKQVNQLISSCCSPPEAQHAALKWWVRKWFDWSWLILALNTPADPRILLFPVLVLFPPELQLQQTPATIRQFTLPPTDSWVVPEACYSFSLPGLSLYFSFPVTCEPLHPLLWPIISCFLLLISSDEARQLLIWANHGA